MDIFSFILDSNFNINTSFHIPSVMIIFLLASLVIGLLAVIKFRNGKKPKNNMELKDVKISLQGQAVTFKPNYVNVDIAYKIWIELHTRKVGLPINLDEDVIAEVYNSWYHFFKLTRELIKEIPSTKFRGDEHTQMLIDNTIEILNDGLRSHLTTWQAKFRRWYEIKLKEEEKNIEISPQEIQQKFPEYKKLTEDLIKVNEELIEYTKTMHKLAFGEPSEKSDKTSEK